MNIFARFDEIQSMALQDIKETKRNGRTHSNYKELYKEINLKRIGPLALFFIINICHVNMNIHLQGLMKFHQWLFKLLRKKSVMDGQMHIWTK